MPESIQGNQLPSDGGDGGHQDGVKGLYAEVGTVSGVVSDIAENLQTSYPVEGLSSLSRHFETISKQFASFAMVKSHPFYMLIHRPDARLSAVNGIAKEAKSVARLFEKYAQTPGRYSAVNTRMQIHRLQMALENLKAALPPVEDQR